MCFISHGECIYTQTDLYWNITDDIYSPNNHVVLDPISNSPVLNRLGLNKNAFTEIGQHLTTEQWVKVRQTQQQRRNKDVTVSEDGKFTYKPKDLEIIPGLHAKVYN